MAKESYITDEPKEYNSCKKYDKKSDDWKITMDQLVKGGCLLNGDAD